MILVNFGAQNSNFDVLFMGEGPFRRYGGKCPQIQQKRAIVKTVTIPLKCLVSDCKALIMA